MSWITNIIGGGMGELIGKVGEVIDSIHTSEEEKQNLRMAQLQIEVAARQAERDMALKLEEAYLKDAENLRELAKVELQSEDPFVRRARPSWLWGLLLMYFINYGVTTIVGYFVQGVAPVDVPYEVHLLSGVLVGGYGYLRTIEKMRAKPPLSK